MVIIMARAIFLLTLIMKIECCPPATPPPPNPPPSPGCNCGIANIAMQNTTTTNNNNRIIGGVDTAPNQYPWQVLLLMEDGRGCGGSIISAKHVLTAAHCVTVPKTTMPINSTEVRIFVGLHALATVVDHERTLVSQILVHPEYTGMGIFGSHYDVAILTMSTPLNFSDTAMPVCLPASVSAQYDGEVATASGWGMINRNLSHQILAEKLQEVNLTVISTWDCGLRWSGLLHLLGLGKISRCFFTIYQKYYIHNIFQFFFNSAKRPINFVE